MPSLNENVAALKRAQIKQRATTEAAALSKVSGARAELDVAARTLDDCRQKLAAIVARPLDSLPDDDKAIDERLFAEGRAEVRIKIAEKALAAAQAALAVAEAEVKADTEVQAPAFEASMRKLERIVEEFDAAFPTRAKALFDLINSALAIEALAGQAKAKAGDPRSALPEFEPGLPHSATLRIELVDATGHVRWRGDQFSNSSTDTRAAK